MANLVLDCFDADTEGPRPGRLVILVLKQFAAKMYGDDGEIGSHDGKYSLHGKARAVSKGLYAAFGKTSQYMQRALDRIRYPAMRGKVGTFRILAQLGDDIPDWICHLSQDDQVQVPTAADVSEQLDYGASAGIPEENAHRSPLGVGWKPRSVTCYITKLWKTPPYSSNAASNATVDGSKSASLTNSHDSRAPCSRSMPESSHSTESGPA